MMNDRPRILLPARPGARDWLCLRHPVRVLTAHTPEEVLPCLRAMEAGVAGGQHAAGFLAYDAAPGLDRTLVSRTPSAVPLAWFGLFDRVEPFTPPARTGAAAPLTCDWRPDTSHSEYLAGLARIRTLLQQGQTYQVNYTMRLHAEFTHDPLAFFWRMHAAQRSAYPVYLETDEFVIASASPELFFDLRGERLHARPMKGTAPRGLTTRRDEQMAAALAASEKERAENVMIVDMVRNDLGRIADAGSVRVPHLFDVEKYPTLWQLTSTVTCRTQASLCDLFRALFPCASITGAPKVRTMRIIRDLERSPRGIYCGSLGYVAPNRQAWFNVAIRTLTVWPAAGTAEYGVGGGIVWDSEPEAEYRECLNKADVLTVDYPEFELLETLLWEGAAGYFLYDRHVARLCDSARYFDFRLDAAAVERALVRAGERLGGRRGVVRLCVTREGRLNVEHRDAPAGSDGRPRRLALAREPVDDADPFLYHKTTRHPVRGRPLTDALGGEAGWPAPPEDVLLWNRRGEVTESSIANLVVEVDGVKGTPRVESGLLAGVFRDWLLETGQIEEVTLSIADVRNADRLFLINSVRKWTPACLLEPDGARAAE